MSSNATTLPVLPYHLDILHRAKGPDGQDQLTLIRIGSADMSEVAHLASHLSRDNPWFVLIKDATGRLQGAFLQGDYLESTTSDEELIELAELWQAEGVAEA